MIPADSFADKNERERRAVTACACDKFNEYVRECRERNVTLTEADSDAIWSGCLRWAGEERRMGLIR